MGIRINLNVNKDSIKGLIESRFVNRSPSIDELLIFCSENKCSDLYIKTNKEPYISRYGNIYKVPCMPVSRKTWNDWANNGGISNELNSSYSLHRMADTSYTIYERQEAKFRYRVSAGFSREENIATFRMISKELPSFSEINFPKKVEEILKDISKQKEKIVLIVGPTGSGKSTSMAACINDFTKEGGAMDNSVIISFEDPVEYIFESTQSVDIIQKELGSDFESFSSGIKQALREHPTFINVGETRDVETIKALVEASRTGHGVFSSFHASGVADTISRLNNHLIDGNKDVIFDLLINISFILCQKIVANGERFILNTQYVLFNDEITEYLIKTIESGKNIQLEINKLFKNEEFVKKGLVKDWD